MSYPRVLVTDADSVKALSIVRALGREMEVYTASDCSMGLASWSHHAKKHIVYNFSAQTEFAEWVLNVCRENNIRIVLTPEEQSSFLLAREVALFSRDGILLTTPPLKALTITMDKWLTLKAAQETGIPIPLTKTPQDIEHALQAANELGYPIVIKPRYSHYWHRDRFLSTEGVLYANSDDRLVEILKVHPEQMPFPLLQKFVRGDGVGIFLLVDSDCKMCAEFAHERLRDLRPTGSGSVLRRSISVDAELREWSMALLRHIGLRGVAMVEFRKDDDTNDVYLMEINGRFWGSLQLAIDAGVNFPRMLVDVTLGRPVQMPSYRTGVIVRWWLGDLVRTFKVMKGKPAGFTGLFPSRWSAIKEFLGPQPRGTKSEVFRWADPLPALGEIVSSLRKLWKKR